MGDYARGHSFSLMLGEREAKVRIEPKGGGNYDVQLDGKLVGSLRRIRQGRFVCQDKKSRREYAGITREQAVTSMVYDCYGR